jgi:hypothetical protein
MKKTAKLRLSRETLRLLSSPDLEWARGQAPTTFPGCRTYTCPTNTCVVTCGGTCDPNACWPTTTFYC